MNHNLKVGIIGEFNPKFPSHSATNAAIHHAAKALSLAVKTSRLTTTLIDNEHSEKPPCSPYKSLRGF